jgi:hypothetical protein
MNDREIERLIKSIKFDAVPPKGLKDKIFERIMTLQGYQKNSFMTDLEWMIIKKPLITACVLSIPISGFLWAVMGEDYMHILSNIIGIR